MFQLLRRRLCFKAPHFYIYHTAGVVCQGNSCQNIYHYYMPREWANLNARHIHYCVRPLLLQGDGSGIELEGGC